MGDAGVLFGEQVNFCICQVHCMHPDEAGVDQAQAMQSGQWARAVFGERLFDFGTGFMNVAVNR